MGGTLEWQARPPHAARSPAGLVPRPPSSPPTPAPRRSGPAHAPSGLWVAGAIGCAMTTLLWTGCGRMFGAMGVAPGVAAHAVHYLRGRCIALPAVLAFFVLAGTFRGFKDTR